MEDNSGLFCQSTVLLLLQFSLEASLETVSWNVFFKKSELINGNSYSKTYLNQPLKNRQKKILMANGSLMKVESIAEGAFCNTFNLH